MASEPPTGLDERWEALIAEVTMGLRAWRAAHPRATFREIEAALDERLDALRARMLADLALASAAADLSGEPAVHRARCPDCGGRLAPRGKKERGVLTRGGQEVRLARDWATCPACGAGLFPPR
jgi:uncharacterized protein with PIN domain